MTEAEKEPEFLDFQHFRVPIVDGRPLELGRGAMGITYKAYDQSLHIDVALKVINSAILSGGNVRERFLREARAAASLRHPGVAAVTYLGEQGDDVFYSMEFVEGETVEARIRREGAMPVHLALHVVAEVASALTAAERQGLVHRDIKPSNIMLVAGDDPDEPGVKVIDFGLAKNIGGTDASATLTQGGFLGTPHFASPEQLEESHVDTRSDIYSLGVTLFYMLAGHTPFSGSTAQVMSQQLSREPPIDDLADQPEPVLALLRRMLAKKPTGRPAAAAELRRQALAVLDEVAGVPAPALPAPAIVPPPPAVDDDAMATVVTPELVLETGTVVRGRFELRQRVATSAAVTRFTAADHQRDGQPVEVIFFNRDTPERTRQCAAFEKHATALAGVTAPAVEAILCHEQIGQRFCVVVDRPSGTSLLNVLKSRGSLPLAEALLILRPLAAACDELTAFAITHPGFSLFDIDLTPPGQPSTPLDDWAPFEVKFDALCAGSFDAAPLEGTLVKPSGSHTDDATPAPLSSVTCLASLAYEILGGSRIDSFHDRWTPLAELSQGGNLIIKRGLETPASFTSGTQFIAALAGNTVVLTPSGPVTRATSVPGPIAATAASATPPPLPLLPATPRPKKRSAVPFVVGALALLLMVGGGTAVVVFSGILRPKKDVPATSNPPVDTTPRVVREPNQPQPTPSPGEKTGRELYQPQFDRARQLEQAADHAAALTAYAELAEAHPEDGDLLVAMERVAQSIDARFPDGLPNADFPALRPPLEIAAENNVIPAQFLLGRSLMDLDPTESLKWLIAAAENGRSQSMVLAGLMLASGRGVDQPDLQKAAGWFQKAADRRDMNGTFYLADCYNSGKGVTRDEKRAAELLTVAAELGDDRAMDWLGDMYRKGNGVPGRDLKKAFDLYSQAVQQGNRSAKAGLGVMYMLGENVEPNPDKAVALWKEGAEAGDPYCMFLYATSIEDAARNNDKAGATPWYVRAAQAGESHAMQWCVENGVSFADAPAGQTP